MQRNLLKVEPAINWKRVTCQRRTSKNTRNLDGSTPELAIRSCHTSQRIHWFNSCQLTTTWMCNISLQAATSEKEMKKWTLHLVHLQNLKKSTVAITMNIYYCTWIKRTTLNSLKIGEMSLMILSRWHVLCR